MGNEKCQSQGHTWFCLQSEGSLKELKSRFKLSNEQVDLINVDNSKTEQVCPGGRIVCIDCNGLFPDGRAFQEEGIDFKSLRSKLIRPNFKKNS